MYRYGRSIISVCAVLTNSPTQLYVFLSTHILYNLYNIAQRLTMHQVQEIKSHYQYWNSHLVNSQYRQHTKYSQLVSSSGFIMVTIFITAHDWRMVSVTYFKGYKSIPYSTLSLQFCAIIIRYVIFTVFNELPSRRSGAGHLHRQQ